MSIRITNRDLAPCIGNDKASEPGMLLAENHHKSLEVTHSKKSAIHGENKMLGLQVLCKCMVEVHV